MTNEENTSGESSQDPKERFKEALKKKRQANKSGPQSVGDKSKVKGGQSSGNSQRMFRRKSGSS
jgi:hypothetical protein